jgi:hypothetical protein
MVLGGMACLLFDNGVRCGRGWDGTKRIQLEPVPLGVAASDIVDIAVSGYSVCVVAKAGTVTCWGPTARPYVMDGADWQKLLDAGYKKPRVVPALDDAVQISMTDMYACVTTRSGHARCWGDNEYGELGDGTLGTTPTTEPSWVSWFHPRQMPGPGEQAFGCRPDPDVARECQANADAGKPYCALEPPPGYWTFGGNQGTRCDDACMQRHMDELNRRAIPACICTCAARFQGQPGIDVAKPPPVPRP